VRVASAAATLLIGFGLSRILGALREVVLTSQFGATTEYDLYIAAFRIPDVVFTLVAGGALGSTLVPVLAERRERHGAGSDARLAATVFNAVALVSALAAVVLAVLTPWLAPFVGAGFDPSEQARLALLMRILLLQPILLGVSEVLTRYLNVHGHFLTPALAPALYNVPIMVAALVFGRELGGVGLALGVLAGALLYLLVQIPAALTAGFRFRPALELRDPGLTQIGRLMVPRMIGQGAVQLAFIATTRLASEQPEGSLVVLNIAWVLMNLPLGPLGMALGNAALPVMSAHAARGDLKALGVTARRTLGAILLLILPAALLLIGAALPIVRLLYERGPFLPEDSLRAAIALATVSGADINERCGFMWISASHTASRPQSSAASIWAKEFRNASACEAASVDQNSWKMPNSMPAQPPGSVAAPAGGAPPHRFAGIMPGIEQAT